MRLGLGLDLTDVVFVNPRATGAASFDPDFEYWPQDNAGVVLNHATFNFVDGSFTFDTTPGASITTTAAATMEAGTYHFQCDSDTSFSVAIGGRTSTTFDTNGTSVQEVDIDSPAIDQTISITDDFGDGGTVSNISVKRIA